MKGNPVGATRRDLRALIEWGSPSGLTDRQLLERFASRRVDGGELAFSALVERHGPMVLRACRGILRDEHEAMDAYQATFLVLARKGPSLWVRDSLGPWLHRVACRAAGRARAGAARRRAIERRLAGIAAPAGRGQDDRGDLAAVVHEEVDRLPERFRVPIVLCDLEGWTSEEVARHLGCPVGTVGSRLSRGRERLRGRLARRGLAPATAAILAREAVGAASPDAPARIAALVRMSIESGRVPAGASSAAVAKLAEDVARSLLMVKIRSVAVALATVCGAFLVAGITYRAVAQAAPRPPEAPPRGQGEAAPKPKDDDPLDQRGREKDALLRHLGNLPPIIRDGQKSRPTVREATLLRDGTVKLWSLEAKDPICPPLRHKGPIREITFLDDAGLLVTTSDDSVKFWDGVTGGLRKEMDGYFIQPLSHSDHGSGQLAMVEVGGRTVSIWDVKTLVAVAAVRPKGSSRLIGAGLSKDGGTLATIGEDHSVTLRLAASGRPFATLQQPTPAIARVFVEKETWTDRLILKLDAPFWESVRFLLPAAVGSAKE